MPIEPAEPLEPPKPPRSRPTPARLLIAGLVVLFGVVVVRTAWLSEDAYFTFRCVENWVHGYGARWNVNERVQAYTHPLWFGLMSVVYFVTRHMAASGFALGLACSAATAVVLVRRVGSSWQGTALALACLTLSKSFTDYSTSGLENPLSHLLLLLFFARFWRDETRELSQGDSSRELAITCGFGGLLVCNRLDLGLILAPALVYLLWPPRLSIRRVLAIGVGFSPLIVWEIISLIYYGFLVPNTAYAKLGSDLARDALWRQGWRYFENSLVWDPITLATIAAAIVLGLRFARARPKHFCAALGVLLYLAYIVEIGGDYMSGRFFSAPLAVAAGLIANFEWPTPVRPRLRTAGLAASAAAIVFLGFVQAASPTVFAGKDYTRKRLGSSNLVDDERGNRHGYAGLISDRRKPFLASSIWYRRGLRHREKAEGRTTPLVIVDANGGYMGYAAGPKVHYVNPYGITDPLLARLPGNYRAPGHVRREVPSRYLRAIGKRGKIRDPDLHAYWKDLALIIRGPIWSRRRWAAIWRMHTGQNQHLLDAYLAKHPE